VGAKASPRGVTGGQDGGEHVRASMAAPFLPPYAKPNWCEWCAAYHPKFYLDCLRPAGQWVCPGEFGANGKLRDHCGECAS
jgi:hypothetical protein